MNTTEAGLLLTKASAYDQRTVGRADMEAWAEALTEADVRVEDALVAVSMHFRESPDRLMPFHVITKVRQIRRERLAKGPIMLIPKDLHQAVERQWMRAFTDAVKDGDTDPHATADMAMGIRRRIEIETQRDMTTLRLTPRSA
jgi:hypothetical protein